MAELSQEHFLAWMETVRDVDSKLKPPLIVQKRYRYWGV